MRLIKMADEKTIMIEARINSGFSKYGKKIEGEAFEVGAADGEAFIRSGVAVKSDKKKPFRPEVKAPEPEKPAKRNRPGRKEKAADKKEPEQPEEPEE
jgi:hypothetical protein